MHTLEEILQVVSNAVKLTHDRIKFVRSTKREEPHVKLLIIDLVNYLMSLMVNEERRILIQELYENQLGMDGDLDQAQYEMLQHKQVDLEFS
jgi:hypothetical protein